MPLTGSDHALPLVVAGTGAAMVCAEARQKGCHRGRGRRHRAGGLKISGRLLSVLCFPCRGPSAWCWRPLLLHRARELRGLTWSSRPDFPCLSMLRAASIGEAALIFSTAPAPRGEQAKAADSLPKRDRKAAHRAVPVTTKEVTGIDSRA